MSFDIKVKGKEHKIKFNYRLIFSANKKLGTKNEDGQLQNDGAGILFVQVMEKEDSAIINLIQLVDNKASENDALDAIEDYIDALIPEDGNTEEVEKAYNQIFDDLKAEMLASGFFLTKIKKYLENIEKAVEVLAERGTDESKQQVKAMKDLAERVKKEISSSTVPDKD